MRSRRFVLALILPLVIPAMPQCGIVAVAAPVQAGSVRIVGPRDETTPVVNVGNDLQLRVEGASTVTRWRSDSLSVATVGERSGVLTGKAYGFATITAETPAGTAQAIVVVARRTPKRASKAQGDTKTDRGGNVYLSSPRDHVIYTSDGLTADVLAGSRGTAAYREGTGEAAWFNLPTGLGVDLSARGGVYVADTANHCVRRINRGGRVELVVGEPEHAGAMEADRSTAISDAIFSGPRGLVVAGGNLLVSDTENHCIWLVDLERQEVRLVAGEPGVAGLENGRGRSARFNRPTGLAVSTSGRLVAVADTGNNVIRLIGIGVEDDQVTYDVTTLGQASSRRGAEIATAWREDRGEDMFTFTRPESVAIDAVENVYVIDEVSAVVVTRRETVVDVVQLAQFGTLGDPTSVTLSGTQAFVLDGNAANADEAINVVEVGPPTIDPLDPQSVRLGGGETVVVTGSNFAPESLVTLGNREVTNLRVVSARRIEFEVPTGLSAPGGLTVTVATRGGLAQTRLPVVSRPLDELAAGEITTVAGGVRYIGDGQAADTARVNRPAGLAFDALGNLFIADTNNHRVRRVDSTGRITTVAGTELRGISPDGIFATAASLFFPTGVAVDQSGNLYISEREAHRVRRVDASGRISTVAGTGQGSYGGDGGAATSASIRYPEGLAVDASGRLLIADRGNNRIRRVGTDGVITTVAGTGAADFGGDGGLAVAARLNAPRGVAIDGSGTLFIADSGNNRIRRVDADGVITTFAGTGQAAFGGDEGDAAAARLNSPGGVAVDASGNLYIADTANHRVRLIDADHMIHTAAGTGGTDYDGDGIPATTAPLLGPEGVAVDASGNLFIADTYHDRVRVVDETQTIDTVAGTTELTFGGEEGQATAALLATPVGIAMDGEGGYYVADEDNHRVRHVDRFGVITTVAGTGEADFSGDGEAATQARLFSPRSVALDRSGRLFIADSENHCIRLVDREGIIHTVAGVGEVREFSGDGGPATSAHLNEPIGIAVDGSGNLYIADTNNHRIRHVSAAGVITTFAGTGQATYGGDGGAATAARLNSPRGVALDASGSLYIADFHNNRVRKVDAAKQISTYAGTGEQGDSGDGGAATAARLYLPRGVAVDSSGALYIAARGNNRVRRVSPAGLISTVAGTSEFGYTGDDGPAALARLFEPSGVAVDASGDLYIVDSGNNAIRAVRRPGGGGGAEPPSIRVARFKEAAGKLFVKGRRFGTSGAVVTVNGTDVSGHISSQADRKIELRGAAPELALRAGANEITVAVGGRTSAVYVLTR